MKQVRVAPGKLNEASMDFAAHHDFAVKTCRAYRPRTKGKVERPVEYLKDNFLAGRTFQSLDDLNAQVQHWLDRTANVRVHATTRANAAHAEFTWVCVFRDNPTRLATRLGFAFGINPRYMSGMLW